MKPSLMSVILVGALSVSFSGHSEEQSAEQHEAKHAETYAKPRTLDEVQERIDKQAPQLLALSRKYKASGRLAVSLIIEPDGSVSSCQVVSSRVSNPEFEGEVVALIKATKFAARSASAFTVPMYPIYFAPES